MTRSDQLRQALEWYDRGESHTAWGPDLDNMGAIEDAAKFALRVWEGDEQLVQRIAAAIRDTDYSHVSFPMHAAHAVLAAITEEGERDEASANRPVPSRD